MGLVDMGEHHTTVIQRLLQQAGLVPNLGKLAPLSGDGSDRPFFRIGLQERTYIAVFPSPTMPRAQAEAHSTWLIGRHLWQAGVPVPEIYAYDQPSGAILFEDLGTRLLFHEVQTGDEAAVHGLYRQAVVILADFQLGARAGFQADWCWDTPRYDQELMINRESNYFAREFCSKFIGFSLPSGLQEEFLALAERIAKTPCNHLMHRDYQSRNLMVVDGRLRVIDFQGARFGPLAYDLAALLNDPYVSIKDTAKSDLLNCYLQQAATYISLDPVRFMEEYYPIALQRNLQVLGAYAFLVQERGKEFFRSYIDPALERLLTLLADTTMAADYPVLYDLVGQIAALRRENQNHHAG